MDLPESIDRIVAEEESVLERFYEVFLKRFPEAKPYFDGIHLQSQSAMLAVSLAAIKMYPNFPHSTTIYFKVLGGRHQRLGIPRRLYPHFTSALLDVVAQFHGNDWNNMLAGKWSAALSHVVDIMMEGYRE
jgi:hemoglobin-like flavoprotein